MSDLSDAAVLISVLVYKCIIPYKTDYLQVNYGIFSV